MLYTLSHNCTHLHATAHLPLLAGARAADTEPQGMNGNGNGFAGNHLGVNVAYTKFFFVTPARDD